MVTILVINDVIRLVVKRAVMQDLLHIDIREIIHEMVSQGYSAVSRNKHRFRIFNALT